MVTDGPFAETSHRALEFSALSLLALATVLAVLDGLVVLFACMRFETKIPFAGSCSWVISAACHTPDHDEVDHAMGKFKWGVVYEGSEAEGTVGHCCLSSGKVKKPLSGNVYK